MVRSIACMLGVLSGLAGSLSSLAGCGDSGGSSSSGGTLSVGTSAEVNNTLYRLSGATFEIAGAESATLSTPTPPTELPLQETLAPGQYTIELVEPGWVLEREMGTAFEAVTGATLSSMNPLTVTVVQGQIVRTGFVFSADGVSVDLTDTPDEDDQSYD